MKKTFPLFYKIYLIVIAVFLVALTGFLFWLNGWLTSYNASLPETVSASFYNEVFVGKDTDRIIELSEAQTSEFETKDDLALFIADKLTDLSYTSVSTSEENVAKYVVKSGEYKIADYTLVKDDGKWTPDKVSLYLPDGEEYRVKLLSTDTLYINGKAVSKDYITSAEEHISKNYLPEWVTAPEWITYTVSGLLSKPEIKVVDRNGNEPKLYDANGLLTAEVIYDTAEEEIAQRVLDGAMQYAIYMQNDTTFSALHPYFEKDTELYKKIREALTMFSLTHQGYEFEDVSVSEYFRYDSETVSMRVSFVHILKKNYSEDYRNPMDITYFARLVNGEYMIYEAYNN